MRKLTERTIVVASHNAGKVREINDLIGPFGFSAKSAAELDLPVPVEDGTSFEENAAIKAKSASRATNLPALADDSGLCVNALDGAPGIFTADWAEKPDGTGRDFTMAMEKVNSALDAKNTIEFRDRAASFVAVLCLAWPDGHTEFFRGEIAGEIIWPPKGDAGFGYDPVFKPEGHDRTFGEMTAEEKHGWSPNSDHDGLSHRARAFAKLARLCLANEG